MFELFLIALVGPVSALPTPWPPRQQVTSQDLNEVLGRADAALEDARKGYEEAKLRGDLAAFLQANFRLEEARIKFLALQELGQGDLARTAASRLRACIQLQKLINDGKAAVSPRPAEPSSSTSPPSNSPPSSIPQPPAVEQPVAVLARPRPPDPEKLKAIEKSVKDLFKEHYSKKDAPDRKVLAQLLLAEAGKSQKDPPAVWVLCMEANEAAQQALDVQTSMRSIDYVAEFFDIDPVLMKASSLGVMARLAKLPLENATVAEGLLALIEPMVAADMFDAADKAAQSALGLARKSGSSALLARATTRAKEVADAKVLHASSKSTIDTLAKKPDDPAANLEMGKFLCFAKGAWDLGLRFLVKGPEGPLRAAAKQELSLPTAPSDRAALADAWFDLYEKERSPLYKYRLLDHAREAYRAALLDADGLLRTRLEKRLEFMGAPGTLPGQPGGPGSIDMTAMTPKRSEVGWGRLYVNSNDAQVPVLVEGKPCESYFYAHAQSILVLDIPAGSRQFLATGVKLKPECAGTWKYRVLVDGRLLLDSRPLKDVKNAELEISVNLPASAKEITLVTDSLGHNGEDWSVWAFPRFQR